ncbi:MAG: STAS domain-containing protein [Spirochaetaceae bacterium]|jgi:stage II sporulation protein AA (anti-sigma F factor antagonist)|nr:STAS domain-containing protein [Spirochaetaceae bacterium]
MGIVESRQDSRLILSTDVRLDAVSAPQLAEKLEHIALTDRTVKLLVIDMSKTIYLSSLGLRVLLQGLKVMKSVGGNMLIQNINSQIRPVFEMTGLMELMVREEKLIILRKDEARTGITLSLAGKLTDETANQFEAEINRIADKYADIYLDCSDLKFISNDGFKALKAVRDRVSKNKDGILTLVNFPESMKRLLAVEKLDELLYLSPVSVKAESGKVFFSLAGNVDDLAAPALRKHLEQILKNKKVKEIYFYLGSLNTVSKQIIITFVELWDELVKTGIAVKLTPVNPDAAG